MCGFTFPFDRLCDSLVLSYLYNPALEGGHSLEAYGTRLKFPKGNHTDWSKFSEQMLEYCERDVDLLELVHDALLKRMNVVGFSELSALIEHDIRHIIDIQEQNGCWFNTLGAESLCADLTKRVSDLAEPIQKLFPPTLEEVGHYTRRFRKDGSDYASYEKHLRGHDLVRHNEDGTYDTLDYKEFNIGSPKQRLERLLELGYEPTAKTKKGNPKIDEDSLLAYAELSGRPELIAMAEWLVTKGRLQMIAGNPETGTKGWLGWVQEDHRIHGRIMTCGATTRRMSHNSPNQANIPSGAKAKYGHECRACWGVEPGKGLVMVGVDASGLENVGMLHYLSNPKATKILLNPKPNDVHSMNARSLSEALGRAIDREWGAKTSYFAWLFGAYPKKIGEILKGPPADGQTAINIFYNNVPGLKKLIDNIQSEWHNNSGLLRTIDGGYVRCPSLNAALNYKIQSLGAIVMKLACISLKEDATRKGIDFNYLLNVHDEFQMETLESNGRMLGEIAVKAISNAAESLNFNIALGGEYKIGTSWDETH